MPTTKKWETVISPKHETGAPSGVRRMRVPGGYLYQVEHHTETDDDSIVWVEWSQPVFVPFHGDGE